MGVYIMKSLYEEVSEKLAKDPRLTKRGGARFDMSLLLFNSRDAINELWIAADRYIQSRDGDDVSELRNAVEKLRSVFGERS